MSRRDNREHGPRGGAEHLARIHGTEEDKVNCPFYFKIGACRHGDKCSRQHHRPPFSETVIIKHMWNNPLCAVASTGGDLTMVDRSKLQENLDEFYEEIFDELTKFGKVDDVQVCENLGDHMVGNVYIKFKDEEDAELALQGLNGRFYAGRQLLVEHCPVTDFKEARCRQFDEGTCNRGPYCNFMHVCEPSTDLRRHLQKEHGFNGGRMVWGGRGGDRGGQGRFQNRDRGDRGGGERDRGDRGAREREERERDQRGGDRERDRGGDRDRDRDRRRDSRDRDHRRERSGDRSRDRRHRDNSRDREPKRNREEPPVDIVPK